MDRIARKCICCADTAEKPGAGVPTDEGKLSPFLTWVAPGWTEIDLSLRPHSAKAAKAAESIRRKQYGLRLWKWLFRNRVSAESLPLDMWLEILSYLSWTDVLAFRMTCKRMTEISTNRQVWIAQYRHLCASVTDPPGRGQHAMYTSSQDLEYVTLSRFQREALWRSPISRLHLTPGMSMPEREKKRLVNGRWILCSSRYSRKPLLVYDACKPTAPPDELVELADIFDDIRSVASLLIDVDYTQPHLVFHLCVAVYLDGPSPAGIIVYRVVQSGIGAGATLSASMVNSFLTPFDGIFAKRPLDFRGRYLLRHFWPLGSNDNSDIQPRIEVFDWVESSSETHVMAIIDVTQVPAVFYKLLPNNQLLVCRENALQLFQISSRSSIASHKVLALTETLTPFWEDTRYPVGGNHNYAISIPAFHLPSNSFRITYTVGRGVYGVIVPAFGEGHPEHIKLSENAFSPGSCVLGADKYIYRHNAEWGARGSLVWPDDDTTLLHDRPNSEVAGHTDSPSSSTDVQISLSGVGLLILQDCTATVLVSHSSEYAILHV